MRQIILASKVAILSASPALADMKIDSDGLTAQFGNVNVRGRAAVGVQGAWFERLRPGANDKGTPDTGLEFDGSARLIIEYETDNGLLFGLRGEVDTGNVEVDDFERDEIYAYMASELGRIEVGENDGPADTLSFHAPTIGLGQVRGDFGRYTGSIALLSPYDTRDDFKVSYFSPPIRGFRAGLSYSPEFKINEDAADPTDRQLQNNVVELGAQYVRPAGDWVVGVSGAYVTGEADTITNREDLESWSVGGEVRRGRATFGAAFVDRGLSNRRATSDDESEVNAGLAWRADKWRSAVSYAVTSRGDDREIRRYGLGLEVDITKNVYMRLDGVSLQEQRTGLPDEEGWVAISEVGLRF